MTTTPVVRRLLILVLVAAMLPIAGCAKQAATARTQTVMVGPGACDLAPATMLRLSPTAGDQMRWDRVLTAQPLQIIFRKNNLPVPAQPFMNMTQNTNGDWVIGPDLTSGPINPQLNIPDTGLTYKYDQILAGTPCDGRIIIQR